MNNGSHGRDFETVAFAFPDDASPERLDRYIGRSETLHITRSRIQKLIKEGLVTVDGHPAWHHQILKAGQKVVIRIPAAEEISYGPENIPLKIVYEDKYLLVVDKPAGMVTHPGAGNATGTLVNALLSYSGALSGVGGVDRPGIVHRLDKETSGLLLVARTDEIHLLLQKALQERTIKKTYIALICGHVKKEEGMIDLPVGRSIRDRKKMTVTRLKGREALTEYKLVKRYRLYDLLEVNLLTGRTHQIRVHFSHLGHPIFGDPDYGGRQKWHSGIYSADRIMAMKGLEMMPRQALHAARLAFVHPVNGIALALESPLPDDFKNLLVFLDKEES